MPSVNQITLMGHLGQDAETRFTPNGVAVTNFSLATTRRWKASPQDAEFQERTDWHRVVAWRCSDKLQEYLKKGNLVYVQGRSETRQYTDKQGIERWITEVIALRVDFLREPFRSGSGPRDEDAPAGPEIPPPSDADVPF